MPNQTLEDELKQLIKEQREIEAIKLYCHEMNESINEGKAEIERVKQVIYQERIKQGKEIEPILIELIKEGKRVAAIKAYYDATACSLEEAKQYVDQLSLSVDRINHDFMYEDDEQVVIDLFLEKGKKVAIKWYQEKYEIDLEQAKDFVDEILRKSALDKSKRKPKFLDKLLVILIIILIVLLLNSLFA